MNFNILSALTKYSEFFIRWGVGIYIPRNLADCNLASTLFTSVSIIFNWINALIILSRYSSLKISSKVRFSGDRLHIIAIYLLLYVYHVCCLTWRKNVSWWNKDDLIYVIRLTQLWKIHKNFHRMNFWYFKLTLLQKRI